MLLRDDVCVILSLAVFIEHRLETDTHRDTQRHTHMGHSIHHACVASRAKMAHVKGAWLGTTLLLGVVCHP